MNKDNRKRSKDDIGIYLVVFAELFDHTKETKEKKTLIYHDILNPFIFAKCQSFYLCHKNEIVYNDYFFIVNSEDKQTNSSRCFIKRFER
jgi:hypothetical protein